MKHVGYLCSFIILSFTFWGCQPNTIEEIKKISEQDTFPVAVINNAEVYYSDSGVVTMHIFAPSIKNYLYPTNITLLEGELKGNFYDSLGQVRSVIHCNFAKLDDKNGIVELRKNVKVFNILDKTEFYSEELLWNRREHIITSTKFIRIVTPDKIIWGDGLQSDEEMKNYKILKPKGEINVKEL